jgi:hypothetical protein
LRCIDGWRDEGDHRRGTAAALERNGEAQHCCRDASVSETGNATTSGEIFTAVLTDSHGVLLVTTAAAGGGGTITPSNGGKTLTVSGTLAQLNADLTTLTDTDATTAADTITVNAKDSFGNTAASKSIAVTVKPPSGLPAITAPTAATVGVGQTDPIGGISVAETPTISGETFTAVLTDTGGVLSATTSAADGGKITPSNGGKTLTISGTLAQLNTDLTTLTDTDASTAADTITVSAKDSNGGSAPAASVAVPVNGVPATAASATATVQQNKATPVTGISVSETRNATTSGEIFTAVLTDSHGVLLATSAAAGGGRITPSNGGKTLTISGTLAQLNADLTSLTDTDATTAADTITAPTAATIGVGQTGPISGISVAETPTTFGETFTAVLTDTNGVLSATTSTAGGGGRITPSNGGKTLTISGTLAQSDADLTTLADTDGSTAADAITLNAKDSNGGSAPAASVAVTVNGTLGNGSFTVELSGSNNAVTIGNGNSRVSGGQNANVIGIGNGNSSVSLSGNDNSVTLGNGTGTVVIGGSGNTLSLGSGNESVFVGGGGNKITVGTGNSTISLGNGGNAITAGNGNDTVILAGSGSTVTLGNGIDTVHGVSGDTINLANTTLALYGTRETVFIGSGNATVNDFSTGLDLKIGPTAGVDVLSHFASDPGGVVDLIGGIGGFKSAAAVLSALKSDGHGGTLLSFGSGSSLDFTGVASSQLHASNFQIG